jgi:hypothetical protein
MPFPVRLELLRRCLPAPGRAARASTKFDVVVEFVAVAVAVVAVIAAAAATAPTETPAAAAPAPFPAATAAPAAASGVVEFVWSI